MSNTRIGSFLKWLRISQGITQQQLSENIGVGAASISGFENGDRTPTQAHIDIYAQYFDLPKSDMRVLAALGNDIPDDEERINNVGK